MSGYVATVLLCTYAWVNAGNPCTEEVAIPPTPMERGPYRTKVECFRAVDDMTMLVADQVTLDGLGWFATRCTLQQES